MLNQLRIGIAGPISTIPLKEFLSGDIYNAPVGLGGTTVVELVRGLLRKGFSVSVYSLDPKASIPVVLKGEALTIYYGFYRPRHRMRDLMKSERRSIQSFIAVDNPAIVHSQWTYEYAWAALASGKPTLITVRDWAPTIFRFKPDGFRLVKVLMHFATVFRGYHFTANSPYIQQCLQRYRRTNIPVIPNGLDDREFLAGEKTLNLEQPVIVSLNNGFGKLKNAQSLLQAFSIIRNRIPSCRLLLLGTDFSKDGRAETWARGRGLSKGVSFMGYLDHDAAMKIIENADVLIHPSLEESFGMTLLEAMAKRTPVIAGKSSGAVPWVLDYGKAGVLADAKSPLSIADEAISILTNRDRWKRYSTSGYQYAKGNFSLSKVVEQYLEAYHKVLTGAVAK